MKENVKKLGVDPYKGVRDFYPADMATENKIFNIWRNNCEKYGYEEYGASVLEPADLYRAKSGAEIVNEQTYTFTDRGDREVTLRPEMTPTVARMIAGRRRELVSPIRWFSIPNLFRYEQPQRGRTREHWQLNADIFGVESINAEIEIINLAYDIVRSYGLKDTDFEIRLNNRKVMNYITKEVFGLDETLSQKVSKLIDKKDKLKPEAFQAGVEEIFNSVVISQKFLTLLNSKNFEEFTSLLPQTKEEHVGLKEIRQVIEGLERLGITNVRFDQTLMRGFDYYTGIVFEIFDLNPINRRSVFGGGRYDDLLALFGNDKMPAVGFGTGDLIAKDLMETYGTLPKRNDIADVSICIVGEQNTPYSLELAQTLREQGIRVAVDLSNKKLGDQIGNVVKRGIPKVICIGDEEIKTGKLCVKTLANGNEEFVTEGEIINILKKN
ncbi:MAG: histidine--tRNA ligase [Candidatus Paceibacterota bacterium]